jgi:hypothetical protein
MNKKSFVLAVILSLTALVLSACSLSTPPVVSTVTETAAPASTATPALTATPEPTATRTPRPTYTPRPTPTHNLEATQQLEDMTAKVKEYYDAGYVSTFDGSYKRLPSYVDSWAQINWYQWSPTDSGVLDDFIVRSVVKWQSASKSPNPSGCGFVFRLQEKKRDHYMFFVGLDGYVYASILRAEDYRHMGRGYYGPAGSDGKETVTLIVEDTSFRVLVNDQLVKTFSGVQNDMLDGYLAYTIVSGTNKDYGTRCMFEQTDLWKIKK